MDKDGTLHWDVPAGSWTILRMGYSLTGARNRPSVPAGSGLEVDKLSSKYVQQYFAGYMDPMKAHLGDLIGSTVQYMTLDSWEAGMQNWTDDMIAEFQQRRGYDPTPYLPVLAGRVVENADVSDRFLWDFRSTLADLYAGDFYGTMDSELHKLGMKAYSEASGVALEIPEDTLLNKSHIDIPMAEFWVHALHPESMYYVDVRGAASAAHVYGKPLVATETFTGGGYESPYTLKKIADYWFAQGVNRLVFHTSAEQPLDTKPGNTMVGTHINRNITWAELAKPFMTYVARVSYMLQQGSPVADLAYLLPQGAPSTMPFWGDGLQPAPPAGYDYDVINTDVLLNRTSVAADGRIHVAGSAEMPDGMSYRMLVLPPTTLMTPEVLHKLHELVAAGATIVGPRPTSSPSLLHYPDADAQVRALATDLWGDMDGVTLNQHSFGKGMTYWGITLDEVLTRLKSAPDFASSGWLDNPPAWVHRHTADAEIYFVANQADAPVHLDAQLSRQRKGRAGLAADGRSGDRQQAGRYCWIQHRRAHRPAYRKSPTRHSTRVVCNGVRLHGGPTRSRGARVRVCRLPQRRTRRCAHRIESGRDEADHDQRAVDAHLPGEVGRAGQCADAKAHVVDGQLRSGRQVLLRHSHLQQDGAGACVVVQTGAAHLDRPGQGARHRRSQGKRQLRGADVGPSVSRRCERRAETGSEPA